MFFLLKPSPETVRRFIERQHAQPFSYSAVGATAETPPEGFVVDHNRIQLGQGEAVYDRAVKALRRWRQFDLGWVGIVPESVPIEIGSVVAIRAQAFGSWSLSASRIVYLVDEERPNRKYGFAYGTLPDHVECGEERFMIEWQRDDDSVWYDLLAFSKPRHPLVRLAAPLARGLQKRFGKESMQRMLKEVSTN